MQVVVAGGGSAGHIEPALAVADALRRAEPSIGITALGTARGLETTLVPARGYDLRLIPPVPIPRRLTWQLAAVPARVWASVNATREVLREVKADVVVGFGGYVAASAYLAAATARVPIVVHEANPRPGWANRLGARLSSHVAVSVQGTALPHAHYVGVPLRQTIAQLDRLAVQQQARHRFGLNPQQPVLLVSGGSQGARSLNVALANAAHKLISSGVQVLHVTGPTHQDSVQAQLQTQLSGTTTAEPDTAAEVRLHGHDPVSGGRYLTISYIDQMDQAYAAADVMLCRSGAMTCAELAAVGLPAVFVPLPHGNGEQALNAEPLVKAGGAVMVDDADLDASWVEQHVVGLLTDQPRLSAMGQAMSILGRRDADEVLAHMVLQAASATPSTPSTPPAQGDPHD